MDYDTLSNPTVTHHRHDVSSTLPHTRRGQAPKRIPGASKQLLVHCDSYIYICEIVEQPKCEPKKNAATTKHQTFLTAEHKHTNYSHHRPTPPDKRPFLRSENVSSRCSYCLWLFLCSILCKSPSTANEFSQCRCEIS